MEQYRALLRDAKIEEPATKALPRYNKLTHHCHSFKNLSKCSISSRDFITDRIEGKFSLCSNYSSSVICLGLDLEYVSDFPKRKNLKYFWGVI